MCVGGGGGLWVWCGCVYVKCVYVKCVCSRTLLSGFKMVISGEGL